MKLTTKQQLIAKKVGQEAVLVDWKIAFGGKSYGNRHLERVNKIATRLCEIEGGELFITTIAAWIHDVPLIEGSDEDGKLNSRSIISRFLSKFKELDLETKSKVIEAAVNHECPEGQQLSFEAKLVHDADVVDKSGILGLIRQVYKQTNLIKNRRLQGAADWFEIKNRLTQRSDLVFTESAKFWTSMNNNAIRKISDDEGIRLMEEASIKVDEGMTSDRVAEWLISNNSEWSQLLVSQLNCEYLKIGTKI